MIDREYCGPYSFCASSSVLYIHKTLIQENPSSQSISITVSFHHTTPSTFQHIASPNPLTRCHYIQSFHFLNIPDTFSCIAIIIVRQQFVPSSS